MKTCPICNTEYEDDVNFCKKDGSELVEKVAEEKKCPKCGKTYSQEAAFCMICGVKLISADDKKTCSNCGAELSDGALFCMKCGTKVESEQSDEMASIESSVINEELVKAIINKDENLVKELISKGADANLNFDEFHSVTEKLKWSGFVIESKNYVDGNSGHSVLELAMPHKNCNMNIIEALIDAGAECLPSTVRMAVLTGNSDVVAYLFNYCTDASAFDFSDFRVDWLNRIKKHLRKDMFYTLVNFGLDEDLKYQIDDYYEIFEESDSDDDDPTDFFTVESSEDKIKDIVNKYIKQINKSNTAYTTGACQNPEYRSVMQNVLKNIAVGESLDDILGFIDVTLLGKGKSGLVFSKTSIYEKGPVSSFAMPYSAITSLTMEKKDLVIGNSENYGRGLWIGKIDSIYYDTEILKTCLEEIKAAL